MNFYWFWVFRALTFQIDFYEKFTQSTFPSTELRNDGKIQCTWAMMLIPHTLIHAEAKPCMARANSNQKYPCPMAKTDSKEISRVCIKCVHGNFNLHIDTYLMMLRTKQMYRVQLEYGIPVNCLASWQKALILIASMLSLPIEYQRHRSPDSNSYCSIVCLVRRQSENSLVPSHFPLYDYFHRTLSTHNACIDFCILNSLELV